MSFQEVALAALPLLMMTSTIILISRKWRVYILSLAVQYLAVFLLTGLVWSTGMAAVKLVVGWMASAVLASAQSNNSTFDPEGEGFSGGMLRFIAALIVWMVGFTIAPQLNAWIPAGDVLLYGGTILTGMGLIILGTTTHPIRVIGGLLTLLSGFEVLYAAVETSLLVAGLLAMINLGLALVGSYFLSLQPAGDTP